MARAGGIAFSISPHWALVLATHTHTHTHTEAALGRSPSGEEEERKRERERERIEKGLEGAGREQESQAGRRVEGTGS